MANVPNRDRAVVEPNKITNYLLSGTHPVGWAKARFFKRLGFRESAPEVLIQALLIHVRDNAVAETETSAYGTKYRVDGPLASPYGHNPSVSSIWFISFGEDRPRLITAFPC